MAKLTIDQIDVAGKRVLMRVDFNVPLDSDCRVTDDRRIRMALPSIKSVIERGGRLILMSHLGRPSGKGYEPNLSLQPAADQLQTLLPNVDVTFVPEDCIGESAQAAVSQLGDGQILLLENLRFNPGEKKGDTDFAAKLAVYADVYCNNAFGTAHRPHASMFTVPRLMGDKPKVAGALLQTELKYLSESIEDAQHPFVAVLGGAKVSDKLGAIENLIGKVDSILVGGAMSYTFLQVQGVEIGNSRVEEELLDKAAQLLEKKPGQKTEIILPDDHLCGRDFSADTEFRSFLRGIPEGWMGLDIGPKSVEVFHSYISGAKTIVWNGPMGVFEFPRFSIGTRTVAESIVQATAAGAVSIIGGGDSAAAIEEFGLNEQVSHVSTGGGASLEMLEGKEFDSVNVLDEA